jgi:hypothetical protein
MCGLVLDTGFMVFGLPYPVSKKIGGGIDISWIHLPGD